MKRFATSPENEADDTGKGAQQSVRIVSASNAPRPETTAPASIFAAGQAAKPARQQHVAALDPLAVVIRTGVPLPDVRPGLTAIYPQLWSRMPAGGMVELPDRQAHGLIAHVKKIGGKAAVRKLREGVKGVWRIA